MKHHTSLVLFSIPERFILLETRSSTKIIFVKLGDGRAKCEQVRSIVHIVSSSIPNMSSDNVTVVINMVNFFKPENDPNIALTEKN